STEPSSSTTGTALIACCTSRSATRWYPVSGRTLITSVVITTETRQLFIAGTSSSLATRLARNRRGRQDRVTPAARDLLPYSRPLPAASLRGQEVTAMKLRHIAVGYNGSAASEQAVRWAVREAAGRDVMVLLVTACRSPVPPTAVTRSEER